MNQKFLVLQSAFPGLKVEPESTAKEFVLHPPIGTLWAATKAVQKLFPEVQICTYTNAAIGERTILGIPR